MDEAEQQDENHKQECHQVGQGNRSPPRLGLVHARLRYSARCKSNLPPIRLGAVLRSQGAAGREFLSFLYYLVARCGQMALREQSR